MDVKTRDPKTTSKIMSAIKSTNTRPEIALRKALWHKNMRYRVNYKKLPGSPDIVFTKQKVVVFVDGDFWHGHNWALRGLGSLEEELNRYSVYWREKIRHNVERDKRNNKELVDLGWTVIRIWESDIKANIEECVQKISKVVLEESQNKEK